MSIRYHLVSQPNKKLNSNSEQLFDAADFLPITFGIIMYAIKNLQTLKLIQELWMRIKILKYVLSKYY